MKRFHVRDSLNIGKQNIMATFYTIINFPSQSDGITNDIAAFNASKCRDSVVAKRFVLGLFATQSPKTVDNLTKKIFEGSNHAKYNGYWRDGKVNEFILENNEESA